MPEFVCSVCAKPFSIPAEALAKYPGWVPKYCRAHSPKRGASGGAKAGSSASATDAALGTDTPPRSAAGRSDNWGGEQNYTLEEVLSQFSGGPQSGLFTDGSARPNPGPGGWGAVLVIEGKVIDQRHGHESETTNNRMELTALINGFQMIAADQAIDIYTDSEICVNTINSWAAAWERNNWKRKGGAIKNLDLVKELMQLRHSRPHAQVKWIKAHNGWLWNEYADSLSTAWAREKL